jgi:D-beta-D-heptose 7-phosphate kinase/D-beta-D-heptose 1-phosphate adenosyltransferase
MFYTKETIAPLCEAIHQTDKQLVLATGFFDLLHEEHLNFLRSAKASGDILIVAVESDARAKALKGEGRPVETQELRCQHIMDTNLVDYIIALGDDFNNFDAYDSLMAATKPEIYAVSSHTSHQKSKEFLVEKYGGKLVVVHDFNPAISTTKIISNRL